MKQHYALDALGSYRIPLGKSDLYLGTHALMSRYNRWHTWELVLNASAQWVAYYGDIRLGLSYIHYWTDSTSSYTEPPTITVGLGLNLKPRTSPWNIGLFVRNYDQYYYENWNLNWGVRFYVILQQNLKLLGEFNVRPAGSMSQLATRYETSLKLGLNYVW